MSDLTSELEVPFKMGEAFKQAQSNGLKGTPTPEPTAAEIAAKASKDASDKLVADKIIADKLVADKLIADKGTTTDKDTIVEETEEQIQAKLDILATKDEKTLTEDDKKYIEKYTGTEADEVTTVKQNFEQRYNIKLEGEYSNNEEGFAKLADDVTKIKANNLLQNYLENVPYMKEFFQHAVVEKRGIETFLEKNTTPSHKTIKLEQISDTNDEGVNNKIISNQKVLIKMEFLSKGIKESDADEFINIFEDKGNLFDKAKEAQISLETRHQANLNAKLKAEETRIQEEEQIAEKEYKAMETILETNNFEGIALPATEIKAFKEAMLKPIDDEGHTLIDYKRYKLTLAQRALLDYFVWKDLKVSGLGTVTPPTTKKFTFKKSAIENDKRKGGRINGAGDSIINDKTPGNLFDIKNINFNTLKQQ